MLEILNDSGPAPDLQAQQAASVSRRDFLKILGTTAAAGAAGCADSKRENILPFVRGSREVIPGVAVWYSSTCSECTAGCGIRVRTREGRAVKIEGNPENPVNSGGLCALGQAALQALYDPDRIRQPLERSAGGNGASAFRPISWEEAYRRVAEKLKTSAGRRAILTGESSGALAELLNEWCKKFSVDHVIYDPMQPVALAKASELVFGVDGIPQYHFERAKVILSFGADFLETWVSPCGYSRDWAQGRRSGHPARFIHVEPRLSLTAANADVWLAPEPGTEALLALALLKLVMEQGRGQALAADVRNGLSELVKNVSVSETARSCSLPEERILEVARVLTEAGRSLIVAGGVPASSTDPLGLFVLSALLNLVLGNVGDTVTLNALQKPATSFGQLRKLVEEMAGGGIDLLMIHGTNPAFSLPGGLMFEKAREKAGLVVSFSSHLDETAMLADLILPSHTGLEDWGDSRRVPGVFSLRQPSMTPVFDTRGFGDSLLNLAARADDKAESFGAADFAQYLRNSWMKLASMLGAGKAAGFEEFWKGCLERGGYFAPDVAAAPKVKVSPQAFQVSVRSAEYLARGPQQNRLVLFPYFSVRLFDGRAANLPWLQELPDPVTKIVWENWAEIHPETAAKLDLEQGDLVSLKADWADVVLPVFITTHVHRGIVAVPLGQGHSAYGRFASKAGTGNVYSLLPGKTGDHLALLSTQVLVSRARGRADLVKIQGSDSQMGRPIAQWEGASGQHADSPHHGQISASPLQMYEQREHPLYRWGMTVDLNSCTGCSACVVACYAENNIPVVGKEVCSEGRIMSWLRIERYYDGSPENPQAIFLPMMCQQCSNAPCEPVCPVYATYHNEEGLNAMVYNRCVGTRYCSNNCPYKVRRFNWYDYEFPEPLTWQLNPDLVKRSGGVMEKCTFCVQRIVDARDKAKDQGRLVGDGDVQPACVQSCPARALSFGNFNDEKSLVSRQSREARAYRVLDKDINTQPAVVYLKRLRSEG